MKTSSLPRVIPLPPFPCHLRVQGSSYGQRSGMRSGDLNLVAADVRRRIGRSGLAVRLLTSAATVGGHAGAPDSSELARPASLRKDQRNRLPTVPPINLEIRVQGKDRHIPFRFRHAYQTGVGERHRYVLVAPQQMRDGGEFRRQIEVWNDQPTFQQGQQLFAAPVGLLEEKKGFTQGRIAGPQWRVEAAEHDFRPRVMLIVALQISHQRPGIRDDALRRHSPANAACLRPGRAARHSRCRTGPGSVQTTKRVRRRGRFSDGLPAFRAQTERVIFPHAGPPPSVALLPHQAIVWSVCSWVLACPRGSTITSAATPVRLPTYPHPAIEYAGPMLRRGARVLLTSAATVGGHGVTQPRLGLKISSRSTPRTARSSQPL